MRWTRPTPYMTLLAPLTVILSLYTSLSHALTVSSTVLVIAVDAGTAQSATSILNSYGAPYQTLIVPQAGVALPALNSSTTAGNFGLIVIIGQVAYDFGAAGWQSALTQAQWDQMYAYQLSFGVRMVQMDVFPGPLFGATAIGGCCASEEQLVSISSDAAFTTAGLKVGATLSTQGLWHYPATISDATTTTQFLQFGTNSQFAANSVAGVINNFSGRKQMVFFIGFGTWSLTSTYLNHIWVHWGLRGTYVGYRRTQLCTQIDDMFLETDIYQPAGKIFRVRAADLTAHKTWIGTLNAKLNPGSSYFPEIGHNGNGNIEQSENTNPSSCTPASIEYPDQIDTPLEFQKPLGTGSNVWPTTPTSYVWTSTCASKDPLRQWFNTASNRDVWAHVSHTYTHLELNNATYSDCTKEIAFNVAWAKQQGLTAALRWSGGGLIPPAITGLHNGDCIRAWWDQGLRNAVGDNTRPVLRNQQNDHWPLITTVAGNGFAGYQVSPRWATNIYYNCDLPACTVAEWQATAAGVGDINTLLTLEKNTNTRYLVGLYHDPFMFHQANLRQSDVATTTLPNGTSGKFSLFQMWVETVTTEFVRLVKWPIVSKKHDDIAAGFLQRMQLDGCQPTMQYILDGTAKTITGVQVTANGNSCPVKVPVTVPGTVTSTQGFTTEKLGSDPLTIWASLAGTPVTFTLGAAVPW